MREICARSSPGVSCFLGARHDDGRDREEARARARARSRVPRGRARARRRGARARFLAGRAVHARLNLSSLSGERMRPSAIARESEIEGGSADWCHEFSFPRRDSASAGRRRAAPVRGAGAACPRDRERRGSARSRDAGGDDRARARGRSEWRADARGTAPFRGSNAPNGRRGRPGTALGCRCPARIDRSGIFSQCSRQREKLPRRRAKTRVEKNSVPRTPRSNARSGRGPRPEERPRDVMRLCFTTSHPPARALPLAAAVVVVVALGHPLHVSGKKISHHHHSAGLRPPPPLFTLRSSPGGSRLVGVLFRTPIIFPVHATQVLGFLNASRASASLDPSSGCMSYCHLAVSGRDMRMDSILPPVRRPKVVPRS